MKKYIIGFLVGCIFMMCTPVLADSIIQSIDVIINGVEVQINDKKIDADNISYNGTIYIPIRNFAESMDKKVEWNQASMTINIKDKTIDVINDKKYQNFMKMFDIKKERAATLNGKSYRYYEFLYNGDLNDKDFDIWLSQYKNDLNNYIQTAFNEIGTYGVLNAITDFNRINDNNKKYCISRIIDDIDGLVIENNN